MNLSPATALACAAIGPRLPSRLWVALRLAPPAAAAEFAALRPVTRALRNGSRPAACNAADSASPAACNAW